MEAVENPLRSLPAVDQLLRLPVVGRWVETYGRPLTLEALRLALDEARAQYPQTQSVPDEAALLAQAERRLQEWTRPTLLPVINASGVVLHTNLGRAPLSTAALQAAQAVSLGYSNLEYDLDKGQRGHGWRMLKPCSSACAAWRRRWWSTTTLRRCCWR